MLAVLCLAQPRSFVKFNLPQCDAFDDGVGFVGVGTVFVFAMTDITMNNLFSYGRCWLSIAVVRIDEKITSDSMVCFGRG
jgi:hypothetical protein